MASPILLAVPNVSEGRDLRTIAAIAEAFAGGEGANGSGGDTAEPHDGAPGGEPDGGLSGGVRLLDVHSDEDHHRSVFTLAGRQGELAHALLRGVGVAVERV